MMEPFSPVDCVDSSIKLVYCKACNGQHDRRYRYCEKSVIQQSVNDSDSLVRQADKPFPEQPEAAHGYESLVQQGDALPSPAKHDQREMRYVASDVMQAWHRISDAMEYYAKVALYTPRRNDPPYGETDVGYLARNCMPDVKTVESHLRSREPVSVSLEKCTAEIDAEFDASDRAVELPRKIAKTVLGAAGVSYVD